MKKDLIDFMLKNSGKLPEGMSWTDVANKFNIELPDTEAVRSLTPKDRRTKLIKKTNDIWRTYLGTKEGLRLTKEVYKNGKLAFETFQKQPDPAPDYNSEDFEIDKITTNPHGGAWMKLVKKANIHTEEHLKSLKELLTKEITPIEYKFNKVATPKGIFIHTSDKHIGALTKEDSMYTNKYDREEMENRIVIATLTKIEEHIEMFGTCEDLFIMDYGDALDGFNQKTTGGLRGTSSHILPQQLNNREQHDLYVELHRMLFDIIVEEKYAKNIYYITTSNSNHGGDFEYGAMKHVETYLEVKYPFIKTFVNFKPFNHFIYGDHAIIFGHGKDDEDMKNGFPLVLNDKVTNVLNDYIRINKLQDYNVSVISGDLHQSAETYAKNFRYKKVLSQYGSSKWMHTNFGSGTPGLSSEVFFKYSKKIYKDDDFFEIGHQSNTGIEI